MKHFQITGVTPGDRWMHQPSQKGEKIAKNVKKSDFLKNRKIQRSVAQRVLVLLGWLAVQNTPIFYTLSEKETLVNI